MQNTVSNFNTALPNLEVEHITQSLSVIDLNDLCDATDAAIEAGGGFGWLNIPARDVLEQYWKGVVTMRLRDLFVARLDGTICGAAQIIHPPSSNEAQAHICQINGIFIAPWARRHGLATLLLQKLESFVKGQGYEVIDLDVRESLHLATALYEKAGYELIGHHPRYAKIEGQFVTGRYYTKYL